MIRPGVGSLVSESSQASGPAVSPARPLVLVIDPDQTARSVLSVALSRDGFDVEAVPSISEAQVALRSRPQVVVVDTAEAGAAFCAHARAEGARVVVVGRAEDACARAMVDAAGGEGLVPKPAFARDVAALVRLEYARRSGAKVLTFQAPAMSPAHLLRALLSARRSGSLLLARGRAEVTFAEGRVLTAHFDRRMGLEALVRGLALTDGAYMVSLGPVSGEAELYCSVRELVESLFPRLAKWLQVLQRSVPIDARLVVDFSRLAGALPQLPDDVNRVVQLFDGERRVRDVLLDSPIDETLTLEVATRLYLMGVLANAKHDETHAQKKMPKLFEPRATEAEEQMRDLFAGNLELRAQVEAPPVDDDWSDVIQPSKALEVPVADAGWKAAPLTEAAGTLTEGLPDALIQQLNAFQIAPSVEPRQATPAQRELAGFSRGEAAAEGSAPMDRALAQLEAASREVEALLAGPDARTPIALVNEVPGQAARATPIEVDLAKKVEAPREAKAVELRSAALKAERKAAEARAAEVKAAELKAAELKAAELKAAEVKAAELKAAELKAAELKAAELKAAEVKAVKAAELKDAELRAAELRAAELRAAEVKAAALKAPELKAAELKSAEAKHVVEARHVQPVIELKPVEVTHVTRSHEALEGPLDPQERIDTPALTPAVGDSVASLEAQFFATEPPEAASAPPAAQSLAEAVFGPTSEPEAPAPQKGRRGLVVAAAVAVVAIALAVGAELLMMKAAARADALAAAAALPVPAALVAPVLPDVEPPELYDDHADELAALLTEGRLQYEEGRFADASATFERALEIDASDVQTWLALGLARYDAHDNSGAWEAVTTVLQLDTRNPRAYLLKATMEFDAKETDQARASLKRYLELDPQGQFAADARALMNR